MSENNAAKQQITLGQSTDQESDVSLIISWRDDNLNVADFTDVPFSKQASPRTKRTLTCRYCASSFSKEGELSIHMQLHKRRALTSKPKDHSKIIVCGTEETSFGKSVPPMNFRMCYFCGKPFQQSIKFRRHVGLHKKVVHRKILSPKISLKALFKDSLLKYHRYSHLKRLKAIRGLNGVKSYKFQTKTVAGLRLHYRSIFFGSVPILNTAKTYDGNRRQFNANFYKCHLCPKTSYTAIVAKLHAGSHKRRKCVVCARNFISFIVYKLHGKVHKAESFKSNRELTDTAGKYTTPAPAVVQTRNVCRTCDKSFSSRSCLNRHQRVHTGEMPYKCDDCGEQFRERLILTKHMAKHTGIPLPKNYKCGVCGKSFALSSVYHQHVRGHGEEKFECSYCKKKFTHQKRLDRHLTTHGSDKRFKCEVCDKAFLTKSNMQRHTKIHFEEKPFKCDSCGKGFRQGGNLKTHQRSHTKEKPYQCEICPRRFAQRANLKHHTLLHAGTMTRKCRYCDKDFRNLAKLEKHEIDIHKKPSASSLVELQSLSEADSVKPNGQKGTGTDAPYSDCSAQKIRQEHGKRDIRCLKCNKAFTDAGKYIRHLQSEQKECASFNVQQCIQERSQHITSTHVTGFHRFSDRLCLVTDVSQKQNDHFPVTANYSANPTFPVASGELVRNHSSLNPFFPSHYSNGDFLPPITRFPDAAQGLIVQQYFHGPQSTASSRDCNNLNEADIMQVPVHALPSSSRDEDSSLAHVYASHHGM